ncbi:sigma-70 family RNA polymerase sigma factor [Pseudactinotalea sp. HY158]|uniref:sigma-70 family RNA polymerase sigma factor n=1 Tax=Pseudactinotalea sp. HY158 TaxID=2654547 RepID=UPI00129CD551|nr:sigma-70 family RNA polymerase sigma factor [Pseudactinotalea sp. HY158]QGH69465.1 sigma-70 family RNA polymerase sigma factor [Pseudactinotalea sp. HY158]
MVDRRFLARRFEVQRPRLIAIATHLLGSAADAEDAVQEAWFRLERTDAGALDNLDAWLTTVVSRIALDLLRTPRRARERSWLVEPWSEPAANAPDPETRAVDNDRVAVALMVVLETLSPAERLAFVLHDVFGLRFDEIAEIMGRSEASARQSASRGRRLVRDAPPPRPMAWSAEHSLVRAWLSAVEHGNFDALLALLDEGAVLRADDGARTEILRGAREIAQQAMFAARLAAHSTPIRIDGRPGVAAVMAGRLVSIMAFELRAGRISGIEVLSDPARLERLDLAAILG